MSVHYGQSEIVLNSYSGAAAVSRLIGIIEDSKIDREGAPMGICNASELPGIDQSSQPSMQCNTGCIAEPVRMRNGQELAEGGRDKVSGDLAENEGIQSRGQKSE